MKLGEAIKQHRKEQGFSQKDLAKMLGVSDMTISRMEAGQNIRINQYAVEYLATFLGNEVIDQITDENTVVKQLHAFSADSKIPSDFDRLVYSRPEKKAYHFDNKTLYSTSFLPLIEAHGIPIRPAQLSSQSLSRRTIDLCCEYNNKLWAIDEICFKNPKARHITQLSLFMFIGRAASLPEIDKYSMIIESELVPPSWGAMSGKFTTQLNFDVSVILYNKEANRFDYELDLAFHDDGRGFFDLNVPGKEAESAKLYAAWKSSFAKKND